MTGRIRFLLLALLLAGWGSGCGQRPASEGSLQEVSALKQEVAQLKEETAQLRVENEALKASAGKNRSEPLSSGAVSGQSVATSGQLATPSGQPPESPGSGGEDRFSDIQGTIAEKAIAQMAMLAIFDKTGGEFQPHAPIKRREFVRWLVKANNAYSQDDPKRQIRLAETSKATFDDVPSGDPDFKYIQGMADSGFVIGYDEKTFKPDKFLSREEMIAIKVSADGEVGAQNPSFHDVEGKFSDARSLSKKYYKAIFYDTFPPAQNIPRVFGKLKTFNPQKEVTRAEAALCLERIGRFGSAGEALKKK